MGDPSALLEQVAVFYQQQLEHHPEALRYLELRGLHDSALIRKLQIGYAPGGNLRGHLTAQGCSFDLLLRLGLIHPSGHDTFYPVSYTHLDVYKRQPDSGCREA